MTNREWGAMGNNDLRRFVALGMQGFFMMVCLAIYTVLVNSIASSENIHFVVYYILICFSLFQTGNVAKSIFNLNL